MRVEANAKSFRLSGTRQLFVYTHDGNMFGGSARAIKKNTGALAVSSKKISLEVKAEKAKCMVMFREYNVGENNYIEIGNKSFKILKQFKYFGTTLTLWRRNYFFF